MISGCVPVLSLDADDAGAEAMPRMASALMRAGFDRVRYVRPSKEYKDWNGLMSSRGEEVVRLYIQKQEREYQTVAGGDWEGTRMGINGLVR
jgi:DNA primase